MDADGLFIYGPLREGGAQHAWLKRTGFEGLCAASTPGRLFHLAELNMPALVPGAIPEALPPGPGWVAGEFVGYEDAEDLEAAVENLDGLEYENHGRKSVAGWAYPYGKGRVVFTAVGHTNHAMWIPAHFELQKRAVRWLLKQI